MDMDRAKEIARDQINKHRVIAKHAVGLEMYLTANEHTELAEALETVLEAAK